MAKVTAKNTALAYLTGSTYNAIPQLDALEFSVGDTDEVEVTTYDSANSTREFLATWKTTSPITVSGVYDPGNTHHAWLRTNHGGSAQTFRITLTDAGAATETFSAFIKDFSVQPDMNGALKFSFSLRPTGSFTHAA